MDLAKQENTKKKILDAAFNVFVRNGFKDTTMSHIVNESGLSKGAIYHYYSSKKDLFISLIENNNGSINAMRITNAGNVGIGTTDPKTIFNIFISISSNIIDL